MFTRRAVGSRDWAGRSAVGSYSSISTPSVHFGKAQARPKFCLSRLGRKWQSIRSWEMEGRPVVLQRIHYLNERVWVWLGLRKGIVRRGLVLPIRIAFVSSINLSSS